ncbi:MAG TPA: hypothetical protein VFX49_04375 [Chloroflexota bacterium]|nr:hypothetical protein [Chloroflexota bacterium]
MRRPLDAYGVYLRAAMVAAGMTLVPALPLVARAGRQGAADAEADAARGGPGR